MTGTQILTKFQNMINDVIDTDFAIQLMNDAKDEIEALQDWEQLKQETTYPVSAGYTYTTALSTLPARMALPVAMMDESNYHPYSKFDFQDLYGRRNASFGYFIDLAGGNIYLTGQNHAAKTMHFFYTKYSADIAEATSWAFPDRFHSILPLKMAQLYYYSDAGERGRSWDDKWAIEFERKLASMQLWDGQLKSRSRNPIGSRVGMNPKAVY